MDYYIRRVVINDLFEKGNNFKIELSEGCNCIYGGNGTGKTTIINLIVNSLNVELEALSKVSFTSITILLSKTGQRRALSLFTLHKDEGGDKRGRNIILKYEITNKDKVSQFKLRPGAFSDGIIESYSEETNNLRLSFLEKVNLTHVPLLRMHDSELFGIDTRDEYLYSKLRHRRVSQSQITEIMDPSVRVLSSLQTQFISQANENRKSLTEKLENLKSKLIEKVMLDEGLLDQASRAFKTASSAMKSKFKEVNVEGYVKKLQDVGIDVPQDKIKEHFGVWRHLNENVKKNFEHLEKVETSKSSSEKAANDAFIKFNQSYISLIAMTHLHERFMSVVDDVESMQDEKKKLTQPFDDYETEVNKYFSDKKSFTLSEEGRFYVRSGERRVELQDLSSGEKHILSILGKAVLSSSNGAVFVADEPELSLHLDWQRMILPSIIKLSPKSQIIVATHSPSIFAKGATEIDLEEC